MPVKELESRETDEIKLLYNISRMLDSARRRLSEMLPPILEELSKVMGESARVGVTLLDHDSGLLVMHASHGLTMNQQREGRYEIGEGITGKVFETGRAAIVPDIKDEPEFLNRSMVKGMSRREAASFVCVPIITRTRVVGTLSALHEQECSERLEEDCRLLTIIASLIAHNVQLEQEVMDKETGLEEKKALEARLKERYQVKNMVGNSKSIQDVYQQIAQVSCSNAGVLLLGESGVGKELVANAIHYGSDRADGPFVRVNCAALPESVLESELFGHEKGAFTGAIRRRKGRFEQAHGGTLFLDEIGDFSPAIQVTLLRILQERELERVGGDQTIKVDVRIIAATSRDLEALMQEGRFRADLYYRLNVFPIHVPALRERRGDIPLLADYFVEKYSKGGKNVRRISSTAINMLMTYSWPGNVRELENCIERAVLVSRDEVIRANDLPPTLQTAATSDTVPGGSLQDNLDNLERELLTDALIDLRGNMAAAARRLGVTERIMGLRVKKYGIDPEQYRKKRR